MSVHRQADGWRVKWRENGRQRSRNFSRKRDADAWDREVKRRRQLGPLAVQQLTDRGPSLGEWIAERWAPEHGVTLERSTRERYANVYELHIAPWLDETPVRELTVAQLRAWQAGRLADDVGHGTITKCRTLLSSVLRHAAESEAILANPMTLLRAPKAGQRDAVRPPSPRIVERIRAHLLAPAPRDVAASREDQRSRRGYVLEPLGDEQTRRRDATIVAILAYAGLRPGELRALRWGDVGERTLLIQRSAQEDGSAKTTKTRAARSVRLLAPLAADLREYRLVAGRPADGVLVLAGNDGGAWTKSQWQVWRRDRWAPGCTAAGLHAVPRPYDLRHAFASLLLAEGRAIHYVAAQLGHAPTETLNTYGHLFAEYEDAERIDAEAEIDAARAASSSLATAARSA